MPQINPSIYSTRSPQRKQTNLITNLCVRAQLLQYSRVLHHLPNAENICVNFMLTAVLQCIFHVEFDEALSVHGGHLHIAPIWNQFVESRARASSRPCDRQGSRQSTTQFPERPMLDWRSFLLPVTTIRRSMVSVLHDARQVLQRNRSVQLCPRSIVFLSLLPHMRVIRIIQRIFWSHEIQTEHIFNAFGTGVVEQLSEGESNGLVDVDQVPQGKLPALSSPRTRQRNEANVPLRS